MSTNHLQSSNEGSQPTTNVHRCPEGPAVRVVVAKPGLDGHDRGAKIIARMFRDAGYEVIYTGIFQTPETIVNAALEEDARIIGLSVLSGSHLHHGSEVCRLLKEASAEDTLVLMGGTISDRDAAQLKEVGVDGVFGPGSSTAAILEYVHGALTSPGKAN